MKVSSMRTQQRCVYVTRFLLQHNMLIGEIEKREGEEGGEEGGPGRSQNFN